MLCADDLVEVLGVVITVMVVMPPPFFSAVNVRVDGTSGLS